MKFIFLFLQSICVLFLFSFTTAFAEEFKHGFDPKYTLRDLKIDTWDSKTGMVSNNVTSVFQAKDDYLWITSYNGLQRFDGVNFEVFDQSHIPFLRSGTFHELTQSQDDKLWFATATTGLIGYDGNSFFEHPLKDSLPISIICVLSDSKNNLWIGSKSQGLFMVSNKGEFIRVKKMPAKTVYNIYEDSKGRVWAALDGGGVFRISGEEVVSFEKKDGLSWDLINASFIDYEGVLYLGSGGGLHTIIDNEVNAIPAFKNSKVGDITVDDYGYLWACTNNGLVRYHISNQVYEILTVQDGLPSNRMVDLFFDNEGSLWVSSYEAGLIRLKTSRITTLNTKSGLSSNKVNIIGINEGKHYIGNQNGTVDVFDGKTVRPFELIPEFGHDVIRDFLFDGDIFWIANYNGLLKIEDGEQTFYSESSGLPFIGFRRIFKDSRGNIWLGSRSGGLMRFELNGRHEVFDTNETLGSNYIMDIEEDDDGQLILGTNGAGLVIKNGDQIKQFNVLADDVATLIFAVNAKEDVIWLCTNFGLYYFKNGEINKVSLYPAMRVEKFFDIVFDEKGGSWISSDKGIIHIRQQNLKKFVNGDLEKIPYLKIGVGDGMESDECTGATRSIIDLETEKIWVPTFEGVAILTPGNRPKNKKLPRVIIKSMYVDNDRLFHLDESIQIKPGSFRYVFDVVALSFLDPANVQFGYKLEGIDDDWSRPNTKRTVEYTNLPFGDYELKVIASNNDGIWNTEGTSLKFSVLPFFYETWQFKLVITLVLIILGRVAYVWRTRSIKRTNKKLSKMNNELDRFVYSLSHDLRGPLTSVIGLVGLGLKESSIATKDKYFNLIKDCNTKMDDFIRELINYSKNKNDKIVRKKFSLQTIIEEVVNGLNKRVPSNQVHFNININCDDVFKGDAARIRVVLRNLLHNSMVFSDAENPTVTIDVSYLDQQIHFKIADNGIGIAQKYQNKIFDMFYRSSIKSKGAGLGLYVAKQTCEKLNGAISVSSKVGYGSVFTFSVVIFKVKQKAIKKSSE